MKLISTAPKTVTLTLTRKEASELANLAFGQKEYFADAIYKASQYYEKNDEIPKWRSLRNWWDRVGGQLAAAVRADLYD